MTKHLEGQTEVNRFLAEIEHPLKTEIESLRTLILASFPHLTEHIKWNAPSFCLNGDDFLTMRLFPPKQIQLIFHRGAKVKVMPTEKFISDPFSIFKWAANDRAVASFPNMESIEKQKEALLGAIDAWIKALSQENSN